MVLERAALRGSSRFHWSTDLQWKLSRRISQLLHVSDFGAWVSLHPIYGNGLRNASRGCSVKKKSKNVVKSGNSVIPRQEPKQKPPRVGGVSSGGVNWSRIGRRRNHETDVVYQLAASLKQIREDRGESIAKVAAELNVAPSTLIKFEEKGRPISVQVVLALAQYLDCSLKVEKENPRRK
ncbi:putative transcriptional regulator [Fuerstiella marisgermanici]|uniref:Putative transcriptional regulator n=1 Tax=Fuerstiella marisgermanici TaxID=1891926 RepID=A0A1P8WEP2_9PLAN|nr:putative transcriptional regulator [Fuerstiella marisgermanici]